MAPITKEPCCADSFITSMLYGYNDATQLWESVKILDGKLQIQLVAPSYVRTQTGYPIQNLNNLGVYTLGSQQEFVADSTSTVWCPTAVDTLYPDIAVLVQNITDTVDIVAVQWKFFDGAAGSGMEFNGPVHNLPGGHVNPSQFYVTLDGTFNDCSAKKGHGWESAKLGVQLASGGTNQTIRMNFRRIYI